MRKSRIAWAIFGTLIAALVGAGSVFAREIREGDLCTVAADETVQGNLFALCRYITIDGRVTGDVMGIASSASINGTVEGSVYMAAGRLTVTGSIGRDVHYAGASLRIAEDARLDDARASLYAISLSTLLEETPLSGSITNLGYQLLVRGAVGREISFWGSALEITAPVGGDVDATVGNPQSTGATELATLLTPLEVTLYAPGLRIGETGVIGGQLTYSGPIEGDILGVQPNAPLFIPVTDSPDALVTPPANLLEGISTYPGQVVREWVTLILIGTAALLIAPRALQSSIIHLRWRPIPSFGVGLLVFILSFPLLLLILLVSAALIFLIALLRLSEVTLVTGVVIGVVDFSLAGLFYFTAIFLSRVVVCIALGRLITLRLSGGSSGMRGMFIALIVGSLVLAMGASFPVFGWLINALAAFIGLGAIIILIEGRVDDAREAARAVAREMARNSFPRPPIGAPPLPSDFNPRLDYRAAPGLPPPIGADANPPGMDNLPEGFNWWGSNLD